MIEMQGELVSLMFAAFIISFHRFSKCRKIPKSRHVSFSIGSMKIRPFV